MATIDTLISDVQNWALAGVTGSTTVLTTALCQEFVNAAIRRLQRHHMWRFQARSVLLTIPGGTTNSVVLPPDFVRELALYSYDPSQTNPDAALVPIQKTLKPLWYWSMDPTTNQDPVFPQLRVLTNLSIAQDTRWYFIAYPTLYIVPTPTAALQVLLDYEQNLADFVAGTGYSNTFTTLYPDAVRFGALAEAYWYLQQPDAAAAMEALFRTRTDEAVKHDNAIYSGGTGGSRGK